MKLKSVIVFLKYFLDLIINTDGVFSQPCYPHQTTRIDKWEHAIILNILLGRIVKKLISVENEGGASFYYINSIYLFLFIDMTLAGNATITGENSLVETSMREGKLVTISRYLPRWTYYGRQRLDIFWFHSNFILVHAENRHDL